MFKSASTTDRLLYLRSNCIHPTFRCLFEMIEVGIEGRILHALLRFGGLLQLLLHLQQLCGGRLQRLGRHGREVAQADGARHLPLLPIVVLPDRQQCLEFCTGRGQLFRVLSLWQVPRCSVRSDFWCSFRRGRFRRSFLRSILLLLMLLLFFKGAPVIGRG